MINVRALREKLVGKALLHLQQVVQRPAGERKLLFHMANHWAAAPLHPRRFRELARHGLDLHLNEEERQTVFLLASMRSRNTIRKRKSLNPLRNAITEEATEYVWLRSGRDDDYEVWRRNRKRSKKKTEETKPEAQPRTVPLASDEQDGIATAAGQGEVWSLRALEIRIRAEELEAFCYEQVGRDDGKLINTMRSKTGPNRAAAARALGWSYDKVRYHWEKILAAVERDFEPDPDSESD